MNYSVFDKKGGSLKNIKFFDACVVFIANKLYEEFPRCVDMDTSITLSDDYFKAYRVLRDSELVMTHTLFWLKENGFLTFTEPKGQPTSQDECNIYFSCVRLTVKGFTILKSPPPECMEENTKQSLGSVIQNSVIDKGMTKAVDSAFGIVSSLMG